jgi:hypothetical protein
MDGIEFYKLLEENDEFCAELGRAILAAGRLEGVMIRYFDESEKLGKATLGRLISHAGKYSEFEKLVPHLDTLKEQRNYLTHNIFSLSER